MSSVIASMAVLLLLHTSPSSNFFLSNYKHASHFCIVVAIRYRAMLKLISAPSFLARAHAVAAAAAATSRSFECLVLLLDLIGE